MKITNQKDEQRKRIHKAANTAADYQAAWKDFYAKPSHMMARELITKGGGNPRPAEHKRAFYAKRKLSSPPHSHGSRLA